MAVLKRRASALAIISEGAMRHISCARWSSAPPNWYMLNSPVDTSHSATPAVSSLSAMLTMKLLERSSSMVCSITVPGDITRITSRSTSPLASLGSSICSHMATR